ncbi:hypothetical protein Fmac_030964 [Flemingia macrophylla]|uniref:Uncharacterized protein n=1 Tax=Flemingia macrophylla TaxID=520843 RepID=A0ABD1L147_9FABA
MSFRIRLSSLRGHASRSASNHSFVHRPATTAQPPSPLRPASTATAPHLRAAMKHLKLDRVKKYEYCLPYFYQPIKEDELEQSTKVPIIFPAEPKPVFCEFDWELYELEVLNLFSNVYSFGYQIQLARGRVDVDLQAPHFISVLLLRLRLQTKLCSESPLQGKLDNSG